MAGFERLKEQCAEIAQAMGDTDPMMQMIVASIDGMRTSGMPTAVAKLLKAYKDALVAEDFTDDEAMQIVTHMVPTASGTQR